MVREQPGDGDVAHPNRARGWFIEGFVGEGGRLVRVPLRGFPFVIGREPGLALTIPDRSVSTRHAEITLRDGRLWLRDLGSTNGTWHNRRPVRRPVALSDGDVLHFARTEFRVAREAVATSAESTAAFLIHTLDLPGRFPPDATAFRAMLEGRRLAVYFQPIVPLDPSGAAGAPTAYEALARAEVAGLPTRPDQLLAMAASLSAEAALSRLMRERAAEEARKLPGRPRVFVNTHPAETRDAELIDSLESIRLRFPELRVVLEIHETYVTDVAHMKALSRTLADLGVELAYDDFGAGQGRLVELVEAPPAWLKFDRGLVAGLPEAPPAKVRMVGTLVEMVRGFGIAPLAEGIETPEEARLCAELGFTHAQGFLFGHPAPAERHHAEASGR